MQSFLKPHCYSFFYGKLVYFEQYQEISQSLLQILECWNLISH